jgi:hypothetical protein
VLVVVQLREPACVVAYCDVACGGRLMAGCVLCD